MTNKKVPTLMSQPYTIIGRLIIIGLFALTTLLTKPAHAQAPPPQPTPPSASATNGLLHIGSGNFTEYNPPHNSIHAGDSIEQKIFGNLNTGTDANGKECTQDPSKPQPSWSWTCSTTYSSDGKTFGSSGSDASLTGGQTANLFAKLAAKGYYLVTFQGTVVFYTNCASGPQTVSTPSYGQLFSVDGNDFDFTVGSIAINQGESGTFTSTLTPINNFVGAVNFSSNDPNFGVSGSGYLPPTNLPTNADITISVGKTVQTGPYPVTVRGKDPVSTIYHDKVENVTVFARQAWITYGATNYKDPKTGKPLANQEGQGVATGKADTLYTNFPSSFTGNYSGVWASGSSYSWTASSPKLFSSSQTSTVSGSFSTSSSSGTGNVGKVAGFVVPENNTPPDSAQIMDPPSPGDQDSLNLQLTDAINGKTASASYIINYHDVWENLVPDPAQPTPTQVNAYYYARDPAHNFITAGGNTAATWSVTVTGTATLGIDLTAGFDVGSITKLGFAFKPSVSFSVAMTFGVAYKGSTILPGWHVYPYVDFTYNKKHYLVDNYGNPGYLNTYPQAWADPSTCTDIAQFSAPQLDSNLDPPYPPAD